MRKQSTQGFVLGAFAAALAVWHGMAGREGLTLALSVLAGVTIGVARSLRRHGS